MGIFGKNKNTKLKDNKEDESAQEKQEEKNLKVKKIKDLKPENKRRRKEPIRPWKTLDRVIIFFLIVFTFGLSLYFSARSRGLLVNNPFALKLPKIDLSVKRTVEIGKRNEKNISVRAVEEFIKHTDPLQGEYGLFVYVLDGNDSYEFGVREKEMFQAASLIKLPVMAGMYIEEERQNLDLKTLYKLKKEDKAEGSGSLYYKPAGYELSYRELIRLMGKESDNTAFNICVKILGEERVNEIINDIGMVDTSVDTNETTPYDVGLFFRKLWEGKLLNNKNTTELLSYLTDTKYENHLPAGLPSKIKIAHKYGRETGVVNDAGIVYADNPYIVVIMSKDADLDEADKAFAELSKIVYDAVNGK